jgi:hypothetical protein
VLTAVWQSLKGDVLQQITLDKRKGPVIVDSIHFEPLLVVSGLVFQECWHTRQTGSVCLRDLRDQTLQRLFRGFGLIKQI